MRERIAIAILLTCASCARAEAVIARADAGSAVGALTALEDSQAALAAAAKHGQAELERSLSALRATRTAAAARLAQEQGLEPRCFAPDVVAKADKDACAGKLWQWPPPPQPAPGPPQAAATPGGK